MNRLINQPFHSMHRAADMLCLNFGNTWKEDTLQIRGRTLHRRFPEYSLHLQVQWRFIYQNQILLGSRDIYEPFSQEVGEDWDYDPIGRPNSESSVFDVVSKRVSQELLGHHPVDCAVSPVGDIRIVFSNGYIFEVFIPASYQDEEWRLIDFPKDEHLIFYDTHN